MYVTPKVLGVLVEEVVNMLEPLFNVGRECAVFQSVRKMFQVNRLVCLKVLFHCVHCIFMSQLIKVS